MKRYLLLFLSIIFLSVNSTSQSPEDFPVLNKTDLPGATFSPSRSFTGESLYGYIDGGADLYLEYGFTGVIASEFVYQKRKYKTEIYKMNNPEAAFGIFSVSRFRCKARPAFTTYTCQNKYQLQICAGQYYISIVNESGTGADSTASILIGNIITGKIKNPSADILSFLPGIPAGIIRNESCLVKGKLGVINGASDMENYLKGLEGFTAVILSTQGKTLISIRFDNKESLDKFFVLHNIETSKISEPVIKMAGGETVRKLYNNHFLIEIPAIE